MREIQLESGPSSSATHHLTQPSTTLNRRYVGRPSNLAIEEVAKELPGTSSNDTTGSRPSRLVNLHVSSAEVETFTRQASESDTSHAGASHQSIVPQVVEFGRVESEPQTPAVTPSLSDLQRFVPAEASDLEFSTNSQSASPEPAAQVMTIQQETTIVSAPIDKEKLAMNIAADYAAASLGASLGNTDLATMSGSANSIDEIAQAVSSAIASIRTATEPDEIAQQIASLKAFAETLRSDTSMPEMAELSDTIDKFVSIAMKSSKVKEAAANKKIALSSKANRAASKVTKSSAKVIAKSHSADKKAAGRVAVKAAPKATTARRPVAATAKRPAARPNANSRHVSADEDRALRQALRSVAAIDDEPDTSAKLERRPRARRKGSAKRFALAFTCAAACVAAIIYFVGTNIPDISVRVAAMQTGIEASYPSYVPRDFSLSDISSENGKITLTFNGPDNANFTLIEEKSSWDSSALLRNYVEPTWNESYTTTHEQGITIYISGANAAWVNRGVLYKINAPSDSLTKKQLRNIVVSI